MEITDVRIRNVESNGNLKAYATITFDDCFVVHNIKIISGKEKLFIVMPSRKTKDGMYKDIVHPINSDFRAKIQDKIILVYNEQAE